MWLLLLGTAITATWYCDYRYLVLRLPLLGIASSGICDNAETHFYSVMLSVILFAIYHSVMLSVVLQYIDIQLFTLIHDRMTDKNSGLQNLLFCSPL